MVQRGALADFVDDLQAGGRLTFTRDEALVALGVTPGALKQAALRLSNRGRLVAPRRGFYVIVPLEHRAAGAPPVAAWLPELVRFHGAHLGEVVEVDGEVLVTVDRALRPLRCGRYSLQFRVRRGLPPGD
jgi:hypothetical protein